jgi:hypothetical protein
MTDGLETADQCEDLFYAALRADDPRGVETALAELTLKDPDRAQSLNEILRLALGTDDPKE